MKKFEFSVEKLRRYQQQKLRLAELEIQRARMVLDQSVSQLELLRVRFDDVARCCRDDMEREQNLTHACQDVMQQLQIEIRVADDAVKENHVKWQQIAQLGTLERIKSESYEVLRETEKTAHETEVAKTEMNELSETIMRTWAEKQGGGEL